MPRLSAALLLALVPGLAAAQEPGSVRFADAHVKNDDLLWTETVVVPATQEVVVQVVVGGVVRTEKRAVTVLRQEMITRSAGLKTVKATDAAGTAIAADKLAGLLKESTPVVLVTGPVADKHRALFKDKVIFVELPAPPAPKELPPPPGP